jgi:ribosomal protein S12 methylthiotransferase
MPEKVALISLGCPKNLVDSEMMLGQLQSSGYELTADAADADVIVVNTCGFLQAAAQESVDALLAAAARKKAGKCRAVIAAGCMTQRFGADAPEALPEVDGFLGVGQVHELPSVVDRVLGGHRESRLRGPAAGFEGYGLRIRATPNWTAYVKVSEGCDRKCAFCVIPQIRGPMVSRPMEAIVAEAESLAADGTGEIILIGQDPNRYGVDLGRDLVQIETNAECGMRNAELGKADLSTIPHSAFRIPHSASHLAVLLRRLDRIEALRWVRLMYLFPDRSLEPLIDVLAESSRICRYLDIPFQHAAPEIVRAMNRPGGAETYLDFIARVRAACPDVSLRSTFIVGFPGETERHFEELLAFVRAAELDWVGVFQYSREEGAPAAAYRGRVPRRVAQERYDRLMQLQQEITVTRNRRWLGRTLDVLVEEVSETEAIGRHEGQAPEIDGVVRLDVTDFPPSGRPRPGQWLPARIIDIDHYDLIAIRQERAEGA